MARRSDPLARWLDAERSGLDDEAEEALTALLADLPRPAPPAGFAARALWRARAEGALPPLRAAARPSAFDAALRSRWSQGLLALAVLGSGLAATLLPGLLAPLLGGIHLADLAGALVRALADLGGWLAGAVGLLESLRSLGRALTAPLGSPAVAAALGGCLLLSAAALRLLHDILDRQRSWSYADRL